MTLKDEIIEFLKNNEGARSLHIWDHLNKTKKERWLNSGGIKGWLARRGSLWAEVAIAHVYIDLEDLIATGQIRRRNTLESHRPVVRFYTVNK